MEASPRRFEPCGAEGLAVTSIADGARRLSVEHATPLP